MSGQGSLQTRHRTGRRYAILLVVLLALVAGWTGFWKFAASKAEQTIDGWRAREARSGRIYNCDSQTVGGYPFRIEVICDRASALIRELPIELKAESLFVVAQVYQPGLIISEFRGPLTIGEPGKQPEFVVTWKSARSSVRGTPTAPQRASLVFDNPVVDRMSGTERKSFLHARHIEMHGRVAEGSAASKPAIEIALQLDQTSLPALHPAAAQPIDAMATAVLRGLADFSPKPWAARFREIEAVGGRIDVTQLRIQQGDILAVGSGTLSINRNGRLEGQLRVTMAGLDRFLTAIGAQQRMQASPNMDKMAGALDRIAPGLGDVARQQAGANLSLGINMLGEQTVLEGKRAVALPLRFSDGSVFLGPIPIGNTPALF
ncbi:MAG TPA: DUF2125 domain-containing protein [Pseudolabrys sp.]|nr:DUF2125 domain-containing protein [Pseudolabrys sp.]